MFDESQVFPRYIIHFGKKKTEQVVVSGGVKASSSSNARMWNVDKVCEWLKTLQLSKDYSSLFIQNAIDGAVLVTMSQADIKDIGITAFGDVRKLDMALSALR